ncbi:hypothetical protein RHMOL_Rhmol11G0113400 [Rhododendron molle]|uniref:Uncharacterized protein n=1 Tax=Rhododendron molle TaxID=49168 RepID=A0ACC0LSJ2_RHOML|nr:hypothetical protein RHMOL_Rhmol11G0113400 [Rhododendron molle]
MTPIVNSNYDDNAITNSAQKIKFLYSYRGKILPRPTDGKLRYVGGHTRVLSVDRSVTFADVLVTITSDGELVNLIEEYNRFSLSTNKDLKITAVLFPPKSLKKISPPPSTVSSLDFSSVVIKPPSVAGSWHLNSSRAFGIPAGVRKDGGKVRY